MNTSILLVFVIASVVAVSHAFPSAPDSEQHHENPLASAADSASSDLADSFGSLSHHGASGSADDEAARQKRAFISIGFGGYGGYGGYGGGGYRSKLEIKSKNSN